jgi:hypothetical protein
MAVGNLEGLVDGKDDGGTVGDATGVNVPYSQAPQVSPWLKQWLPKALSEIQIVFFPLWHISTLLSLLPQRVRLVRS